MLHDDAEREYAYGPANGAFSQEPMDEAGQKGRGVLSLRDDWRTIFPAER